MYHIFFHTQQWFLAPTVISNNLRVISDVFVNYHRNIHRGRNKMDHGCPCRTEFTLVSLYSSEITSDSSWFLEYKLTWGNSVRARAPMMDSLCPQVNNATAPQWWLVNIVSINDLMPSAESVLIETVIWCIRLPPRPMNELTHWGLVTP